MKMNAVLWTVLVIALVAIAGCKAPTVDTAPAAPTGDVVLEGSCPVSGPSDDPNCQLVEEEKTPVVTEINFSTPEVGSETELGADESAEEVGVNEPKDVSFKLDAVEGDLVAIKPNAYSPDGVKLTFTFSEPFNENGLWQTKDGDAGKYLVTVTASDGSLSASESVMVTIKPSNKAPKVECPSVVNVKEGELVDIECNIIDIDGDDVVVDYSGWMTSSKKETTFGDFGEHTVVVRAADPTHVSTKQVKVNVEKVYRAPSFEATLKDMTAMETDVITLNVPVSDPDGAKVTLTYSEPFGSDGVWKTTIGDAGTYKVSVVANNGRLSTKQEFTLVVKPINTAPVLKPIAEIVAHEGETIKIPVEATDREGDPLVVKYSGFMSKDTYVTNYDDAYAKGCQARGCTASYITTVTVTDGSLSTSQDVSIKIIDTPRAPIFLKP